MEGLEEHIALNSPEEKRFIKSFNALFVVFPLFLGYTWRDIKNVI